MQALHRSTVRKRPETVLDGDVRCRRVSGSQAGAAWDAGRIRGWLRALGVRRRLVSAQRPGRGWAAMTDSELAVARLVAEDTTLGPKRTRSTFTP
jgi:hypothetical protein